MLHPGADHLATCPVRPLQALALFHPSHVDIQPRSTSQSHLRALPPLTPGQVLVVLRLVEHASAGRDTRSEGVDLAFRQGASAAAAMLIE